MRNPVNLVFLLFFSLFFIKTEAQPVDSLPPFDEHIPQFPGGEKALREFIDKGFNIPKDAFHAHVNGRVVAQFIVEKDGRITDIRISKPLFPSVDSAYLELLRRMPNWVPGDQNGNPVRVRMNLPTTIWTPQKAEPVLYFKNKSNVLDAAGGPPKRLPRIGSGVAPGIGYFLVAPTGFMRGNFTKFNGAAFDVMFLRSNRWAFSFLYNFANARTSKDFIHKGQPIPVKTKAFYGAFQFLPTYSLLRKPSMSLGVYGGLGLASNGLSDAKPNVSYEYSIFSGGLVADFLFSKKNYLHKYRGIVDENWGFRLRLGASPHLGARSAKSEMAYSLGAILILKSRTAAVPEGWKK